MTLVARVTFLVLVGATFSAFFVAQRLKSTPPVIDGPQRSRATSRPTATASATSTRSRSGCRSPTTPRSTSSTSTATASSASPTSAPMPPVPAAAAGLGRHRRRRRGARRTASTGCASRCATRAARRPSRRRRTSTPRRRARRSASASRATTAEAHGQHHLPGRPRGARSTSSGVSPFYATQFRVLRTDDGKPREVTQFELKAGAHRKVWDGPTSTASRSRPARTSSSPRCATRRATSASRPTEFEPGADPRAARA